MPSRLQLRTCAGLLRGSFATGVPISVVIVPEVAISIAVRMVVVVDTASITVPVPFVKPLAVMSRRDP